MTFSIMHPYRRPKARADNRRLSPALVARDTSRRGKFGATDIQKKTAGLHSNDFESEQTGRDSRESVERLALCRSADAVFMEAWWIFGERKGLEEVVVGP